MTWARFDDDFPNHPKVLRAGPLALSLQVRSTCWSSHYLTDGFIPAAAVPALVQGFDAYDPKTPGQWAEHMVECGLWDLADGGFRVHDFKVYNPTKREVLRNRKTTTRQRIEAGRARARTGERSGGRYISPAEEPAATPAEEPAETSASHQPRSRTRTRSRTPALSQARAQSTESTSSPAVAGAAILEGAIIEKNGTAPTTPGSVAFEAYAAAYQTRYTVAPVRNKRTNSLFKQLAELLGPEAPAVAAFYLSHKGQLYVRSKHDPALLVRDAAGLRTEWASGRMVTETGARQADQRAERGDIAARLLEKARRQEIPDDEA